MRKSRKHSEFPIAPPSFELRTPGIQD